MSFDDIVQQNIARRNMQMGVTPSVADTTTDNVEDPLENQQARYGLFPYGNQYGFTKLNQLIDEDGLDSQQRFELQQQWFKNQENYIKQLPPDEQVEWNKTLDEIKSSDTVLKPYSTLGAKAESVGTGVARMQAGVDEVGARVLSHLDKTDSALEKEIANEHQDAYDKYKKAQTKLDQLYSSSLDNPTLLMEREKLEDYLSEDERSSLAWFDNLLAKKRADTVYSDDANFLVKDALAARDVNIARANKKSQYGGAEERRDAIRGAGKDQGFFRAVADTAKAAINDPNAALDVAFESTGANLIPQLVGIAAGAITRSPMVYQVISSVGQAPSEIQSAFQETLQKKYQDKYGKSDLSKITPDELETIITENAKEFSDSFTDGVRNAAIIAAAEPLAAKGVGQVAKGFTKLSSNAKSTTLKALGISGATAAKLTGEGWEEAFGQIATNLVDGKPWDEGVGNSFVMALIGLENVPNTVAVSKDVKNQLAEELGKQPTTSAKPDSTPPTNDPQPVNESEDSSTTTETVTATTEEQPQLNAETENELYTAYRQLIEQRYNDELSEDEFRSAIGAIHAQFDKEIVDQSTGEITIINTFDPAKVYQIGQQNENRSDYSNGGEDDNGSSIQSSIDELDGGRTQSSSNTSEQVSGNETEASSTGDSQSNSEFVENITEQQDDNPQESSATGLNGRTDQTDGSRVDQGEFGEFGSEQVEQPTETTQSNGENGRVQQRTESNSDGETLNAVAAVQHNLVNSNSKYTERPRQKVDEQGFEFFSGGESNGPVVWGTMSSNLAHGYSKKNTENQTISVYKPKADAKINYVVFDGEGRSFNNLVKALNTSPRINGFGKKNSDKVVGVLASTGDYDAVILKNYNDLGGPTRGAKNAEHSDSIVILNKDKFDKVTYKTNDFPAYSNGFKVDTTGLPTKSAKELVQLAKQLKGKKTEPKKADVKQAEPKQTEEQNQPLNETSNMANPLSRQIEQENNKLRKMNVAMEDTTNPYRKKFVGADLRNNQKEVNKLLQDNPQDMALIREAFFNATPNATEGSFQVAQRGYVRYSPHNPQHKAYKGNKQNLLGFDFDGNPVLKNQAELFSELFDDLSVENQTTLVLAQQPETTQQIMNASVRTFFKNSENKPFETEMREAVEVYATEKDILEEDGTKLEGTNENLTIFANNKDFLAWVGDRLRPLFEQLNKIIAGVVAVVTVGAMTIPTDAMAQQGFSAYTQGEVVQGVSQDASNTINWVKQHRDHNGKNFVVADKDSGKIHIVSPEGKVLSTQNALFGKGRGNDKSPMNTPSGRMQLQKETKLNSTEKSIYGDSVLDLVDPTTKAKVRQTNGGIVAMHRVLNKAERKSALNTAQASDNYLSHGCINIPTAFYNTAVDSLDGAMVYVLDHKKPKQSKTTTQPTKTNGVNSLLNYKPTKLFSVSAFKSKQTLNNGMTKDGASRHLQKALGNLADNVILVSREDYTVPNQGAERLIANGVEGFYHAESGAVVIIADSIKAQDGLTAEERLAWVGWHELYHRGLDVKFGEDLANMLDTANDNAFIHQLAMAIKDDRINNNLTALTDQKAVEEALAELGAALATGKVDALSSRYGVSVPNTFTKGDTFLGKLWDNLKQLVSKITGKNRVTDRQVQAILDSAITSVKPDKAERQLADEILNAYADPNNPLTLAAKFSIGSRLKQVGDALRNNQVVDNIVDLFSTNDTHTTGHNPNSSQTRATKVMRKRSIGLLGNIIEGIQDSRYRIDRLDEQGEGGKLSRAVANMSNRTQQKIRTMSKGINDLTREMMNFADTHRDIFPKLSDKKQVDVVVNEVITALRTLTGGNEVIRKNLQEALGGKDFFDQDGNLIHHQKGLLERRQDLREMELNRATLGIPSSPFITSEIARLTREIDDHLAIQQKFDESNNIIIKENKDKNSRKHWHGHNGYTMAEAHALLQQKVKDGLIDNDVLVGVTPRRYDVKQYTGNVDQEGNLEYVMVSHFSYDAKEVEKNFTGEIKPLVDQYEKLSADMHQFTVKELGKKLAGNGTTAKWETSTMGKVKEIYSTNLTDENGNPIVDTFVIENPNSIDEIVTLQKAAEYTGHRTGRAFSGGSALEQLTWRVQLTAQQSSAQEVGAEMYAMYERGGEDTVRVYHIGDKDYTLQKGIVIEVPERDSKGRLKYNADGATKTKLVKVAFKDQEANAALFGDNIKGNNNIRDLSTAGLLWRLVPITVSRLAKFAAQNLTMSPTFGITNAYKGLKEKQNQVLAWGKNSTWVKSLPEDKQRLFDGVSGNNKLYTMFVSHLIQNASKTLSAYEPASLAFAWKLATKQDLHNTNLKGEAKRAYDKLVAIYERGGISSKVEDLFVSTYNKKLQFALGGKANKQLDKAMGVLEKLSVATMSQELVSTLLMTDFLQNELGMEAQMAYDANLHFMNFDKRGASSIANYLRNYTMFANAIAQGSRAYLRGYTEMDRNGKLHLSKQGAIRLSRNIAIGAITHSLAMVIGEMACPEKAGSLNQVGDLNPYQLMREIPIATGCGSFIRFPIEYGVGMTENMFGVAMLQVAKGFWSVEQAGDAILDTIKDNAVPMNMPIGEADSFFGSVVMNLVYPVTPEPARDWLLAFGGVDAFGNQINSKWAGSREYKPAAGKQTTDKAWFEKAEWLYEKGFNVTPEEARAVVTGPFQGVTRQLLTWFIEKDPRVAPYDAILGTKSLWRSAKDEATVAYTVVMNNLNGRYSDLHNLYIKAHGIDKTDPTDSWLEKNNISLSADDRKVLGFITKYRTQMKNTKLSQDQRYKYNMEFLKNLKTVTHPEG